MCYIELTKDKEIKQVQNYAQDKRDIYYRVKNESSKLYAGRDNIEVTYLK